MCLDTGCVFGGRLTALRYPERKLVSVAAQQVWYEPVKPLAPANPTGAVTGREPDMLELGDVAGKRIVSTRHHGRITVPAERAAAALEVMSRFAVDPHWLLYLPPTMSPSATTSEAGLLEHPGEAFAGYRADGVEQVVCEEKHMGSRAVVLVCRDSARARFGIDGGGMVYTRTGRGFFERDGVLDPDQRHPADLGTGRGQRGDDRCRLYRVRQHRRREVRPPVNVRLHLMKLVADHPLLAGRRPFALHQVLDKEAIPDIGGHAPRRGMRVRDQPELFQL